MRIDETPETEDRQIEEAIDVHSEANPVAEPVLEEHKQLVSSEICEHRLVICEIDSQKTLQNECKPSTMNDKANLESVIKMDENPQVSLADDQQLEEEVLDYSEEFLADGPGKSDEISVDSNTQSLEAEEPSSSTLNVDSDDEDKERRDRFSTERKTAAFNKPSGEKKQLNLPDTLDDVVIQDDRHGGINNSNRNRMKINRWSKGPKSPPKAFSVRLVPSQQPRANFGQQLRPQFPQYQSEPTGYLDQQRVHINPHFRGSVSADPSSKKVVLIIGSY